ncbi:sigma-70 family RNA polymerase sigma factor [Acinetobacter baumannii]|uniref:sigma-70 family RNA polymerase sigma factor n=1 Tax=Acinetobacter baumannii TaxID=470 RepID=UPI003891CB42
MARPLRKVNREGVQYTRRSVIEDEIKELEKASNEEIIARASIWPYTIDEFVSSETLLYFFRNTDNSWLREELLIILLERIHRLLPKPNSSDGQTSSLVNMEIRDKVRDDFIDLLLADQISYEERLDYFEVNFNGALASDKLDARKKIQNRDNLTQGLYDEDEEILPEVEISIESYDPFDPNEALLHKPVSKGLFHNIILR